MIFLNIAAHLSVIYAAYGPLEGNDDFLQQDEGFKPFGFYIVQLTDDNGEQEVLVMCESLFHQSELPAKADLEVLVRTEAQFQDALSFFSASGLLSEEKLEQMKEAGWKLLGKREEGSLRKKKDDFENPMRDSLPCQEQVVAESLYKWDQEKKTENPPGGGFEDELEKSLEEGLAFEDESEKEGVLGKGMAKGKMSEEENKELENPKVEKKSRAKKDHKREKISGTRNLKNEPEKKALDLVLAQRQLTEKKASEIYGARRKQGVHKAQAQEKVVISNTEEHTRGSSKCTIKRERVRHSGFWNQQKGEKVRLSGFWNLQEKEMTEIQSGIQEQCWDGKTELEGKMEPLQGGMEEIIGDRRNKKAEAKNRKKIVLEIELDSKEATGEIQKEVKEQGIQFVQECKRAPHEEFVQVLIENSSRNPKANAKTENLMSEEISELSQEAVDADQPKAEGSKSEEPQCLLEEQANEENKHVPGCVQDFTEEEKETMKAELEQARKKLKQVREVMKVSLHMKHKERIEIKKCKINYLDCRKRRGRS